MTFKFIDFSVSETIAKIRIKKLELIGFGCFILHTLIPRKKPRIKLTKEDAIDKRDNPDETKKKNIKFVKREQCMGCGLCFSVCKFNAITMSQDDISFLPKLNEDTCNFCGKCFIACPGANVISYQGKLGDIMNIYVTHAKNSNIRHAASSGGTCRSILISLLEKKIIDKVIITRATDDPFNPETIITASVEDLATDRLNSIYSPTSPLSSLKGIDKNMKYAIAGLPCHIAGLALSKDFRKNIYLSIGIFCSHTPSFQFVKSYLHDLPRKENVQRLSYRGKGWPGKSTVYYKNGKSFSIWFPAMWHKYNERKNFQIPRCGSCTYYSAEFADISIGDPWSLVKEDKSGSSLVFVRTTRGQDVMGEAAALINITEVKPDQRTSILKFHEDSATFKQTQTYRHRDVVHLWTC